MSITPLPRPTATPGEPCRARGEDTALLSTLPITHQHIPWMLGPWPSPAVAVGSLRPQTSLTPCPCPSSLPCPPRGDASERFQAWGVNVQQLLWRQSRIPQHRPNN